MTKITCTAPLLVLKILGRQIGGQIELAFLLAITKVNLYLFFFISFEERTRNPNANTPPVSEKLAFALIFNKRIVDEEIEYQMTRSEAKKRHQIKTAPLHARKFERGEWGLSAKNKYQQHIFKQRGFKNNAVLSALAQEAFGYVRIVSVNMFVKLQPPIEVVIEFNVFDFPKNT